MNKEIQFLIYNTPLENVKIDVVVKNETIWLNQKAMAALFDVLIPAVSKHLKNMKEIFQQSEQTLFNDLSQLIEKSKNFVVVQANSVMTMLFWNVGKRINEDILQNKRADYGKRIVSPLATQLTEKYNKNFETKNLYRMMQFAELFPELEIVAPLARQLSWSHFRELIPINQKKVLPSPRKRAVAERGKGYGRGGDRKK